MPKNRGPTGILVEPPRFHTFHPTFEAEKNTNDSKRVPNYFITTPFQVNFAAG